MPKFERSVISVVGRRFRSQAVVDLENLSVSIVPRCSHERERWPITLLQEKFIREYCIDQNGTQAAIRAGYSARSASPTAARLLTSDNISKTIEAYRNQVLARMDIKAERWLREGAIQTFYDPADAFDDDGRLLPIKQMPPQIRHAIAGVDVEELFDARGIQRGVLKKVRFRDRRRGAGCSGST
jgi:phage terminase small subunit